MYLMIRIRLNVSVWNMFLGHTNELTAVRIVFAPHQVCVGLLDF